MQLHYISVLAMSILLAGCSKPASTEAAKSPVVGSLDAATVMATNAARETMLKVDQAVAQGDKATVAIHVPGQTCTMTLARTGQGDPNKYGWLVDDIKCPNAKKDT